MKKQKIASYFNFLMLLGVSCSVSAHSGTEASQGFSDGLIHPVSGVDHLLVMLAVGLWAASVGGRYLWLLPSVFLTAMAAGGMLGFIGLEITGMEIWVAFSVLALGIILSINKRMPTRIAIGLVAAFAVGHGYVHAAELSSGASMVAYLLGFLTTTTALLAMGMAAKLSGFFTPQALSRHFGMLCSVVGAVLLFGI